MSSLRWAYLAEGASDFAMRGNSSAPDFAHSALNLQLWRAVTTEHEHRTQQAATARNDRAGRDASIDQTCRMLLLPSIRIKLTEMLDTRIP